ncbi:MAG: hypothetical protein HC872_09640 [Gammaproteobacteria bacterium]|nr:hypothetical protein [Gammaproteobacteria bacterium]
MRSLQEGEVRWVLEKGRLSLHGLKRTQLSQQRGSTPREREAWLARSGQGLPQVLNFMVSEIACATNLALAIYVGLSQGAYHGIAAHASDELKRRYLPPLATGLDMRCWCRPHRLGAPQLGHWLCNLVLCDRPDTSPCGQCASCVLLRAGNHPDYHSVQREEDAKQIKIEQVRELASVLALKSYRGGFKTALIAGADEMNVNAANALLKTLEEPAPQTLLVLCSARPSRLPATIVSRCQRLVVTRPSRVDALAWLEARRSSPNWEALLDHAAGEPLRALQMQAGGFGELDSEMQSAVAALGAKSLDVAGTAERWSKNALEARLMWLDVWLGRAIRTGLTGAPALPSMPRHLNIALLYGLLDRVREFRLELATSLNLQLATEVLLLRAENALSAQGREVR